MGRFLFVALGLTGDQNRGLCLQRPISVLTIRAATVGDVKKIALTVALLSAGLAFAQSTAPDTAAPPVVETPAPAPAPATETAQPAPTTAPEAAAQAAAAPAVDPAATIAVVGGKTYTVADFDRSFRYAVARSMNAQGMPFSEDMMEQFAEARADYLKQYTRNLALYQLAQRSTKVTAADVDAEIAKVRSGFKTDAEFTDALGMSGFGSVEEFRADREFQMIISSYLRGLEERFKFGDAVVNNAYKANIAAFKRPTQACVKHILVKTEEAGKDLMNKLQAGGDFAALAKELSQDPGSAQRGGDLGCIQPGQTVPTFDKASFSGPLNQTQLVQSDYGWHVIVVGKRTEAGTAPLTEVAPMIRQQLARDAAQKYLEAQLSKVKVESHPEILPKVTPPAPAPTQKQ